MKESIARRQKRQPIPKRFSGDGSAPPRFRFGFPFCSGCLFRGVCLAAAAQSAAALVYAKHTPRCQKVVFEGSEPKAMARSASNVLEIFHMKE